MNKGVFWLLPAAIVCLSACSETSGPTNSHNLINHPVKTNAPNSFTYTVSAENFSDNSEDPLSFASDTLVVTLTCMNYVSGQAVISVRDSLGGVVFADTVRTNKTTTSSQGKTTKPKSCSITTSALTGKIVFTLSGK
ncbi:MAG TPA: hypothetical protein VMM37_00240 [Bacteroidota bacterium]|nr:hypothetical protein [Bacteroidota bacterium]